jgi:uncharacterized protein (TIRG00374 family)
MALLVSIAVLLFFMLRHGPSVWLPQRLRQFMDLLRLGLLPRSREMVPIVGLTLLIWGLEMGCLALMARAFGVRLGAAEAAFVTTFPAVASSFPLTPGGVGIVDLTLAGCLRVLGVSGVAAVSLTIVNRFFDYWLHLAIGVLIWAVRAWLGFRTWRDAPSSTHPDALDLPVRLQEETHVH